MDIENNTLEELATAAKQGNAEAMSLLWQKNRTLDKYDHSRKDLQ